MSATVQPAFIRRPTAAGAASSKRSFVSNCYRCVNCQMPCQCQMMAEYIIKTKRYNPCKNSRSCGPQFFHDSHVLPQVRNFGRALHTAAFFVSFRSFCRNAQFSTNLAKSGLLLSLFFSSWQAREMQLCNTKHVQQTKSKTTDVCRISPVCFKH